MNDEAIKEFLVESYENLDQLDRDFVALEADPSQQDRIAAIFRTIHTIKGTAGFLAFRRLETVAHSGESLLSLIREGTLTLTPDMTSALLTMVDRVRTMLRSIEATGAEGSTEIEDVMARLNNLRTGTGPQPPAYEPRGPSSAVLFDDSGAKLTPQPEEPSVAPLELSAPSEPAAVASLPVAAAAPASAAAPAPAAPVAAAPAAPAAAAPARAPESPADTTSSSNVSDSNVRVDVGLLDKLMNLVGELVLTRNQIVQYGARLEDAQFVGASQRLNLITTELQEHVMKTRMQPIGNVWSKLPRVVRDLAVSLGKQIRIEMSGKETELDRTVLEAIKDPLTHIVRNAVDHGIESPDVRASRNKPRTGTLRLRAYHEGGQVNIEIADDGGGLRLEAIQKKAVERGLITTERAARLSQHELMQLVFLPGFSTAEKITNVSGRGVGMDVVKTNIERIGGTVELVTTPGAGTTIKIKIPLTLAIVPALTVASGAQRYAIPQSSLVELVGLDGDQARSVIEWVHGTPVYRLRGRLLPLVSLNEQLGQGDRLKTVLDAGRPTNIVVLSADERQFGLVVDEVHDTEEIVVKPLGQELKGIPVFAGATIMGDGRVALILDTLGLAQHANAVSRTREQTHREKPKAAMEREGATIAEHQAWLLFGVGEEGTMAVPLAQVARLEEIPRARLERTGQRIVVQYRGAILPLIELDRMMGHGGSSAEDSLPVIVYSEGDKSVGFVVRRILDVVEDAVTVERMNSQPGVLGAAVVQGKVTDLLDVRGLIRSHDPYFFDSAGRSAA